MSDDFKQEESVRAAEAELAELRKSKDTKEEVKAESQEEVEETQEREFTSVEKEQMKMGWDPDKVDGVSAVEYKRVGEIIEAKRSASQEAKVKSKRIEELETRFAALARHSQEVELAAYNKAVQELHQQKLDRISEGDVTATMEIERKQSALRPPVMEPVKVGKTDEEIMNDPNVISLRDEFKKELEGKTEDDLAIAAYIIQKGSSYKTLNTDDDVKNAVEEIRVGAKKLAAKLNKNPNQDKPGMTMTSTASTGGKESSSYSVSRLSYEQRAVFDELKRAEPTYPLKKFIDQLELTGRLNK